MELEATPELVYAQYFEDGRFVPARVGQDIMNITRFVTLKDTGEIWAYDKGLWKPDGESFIRNVVTGIMGDVSKRSYGEEVVYYIRTVTYVDRDVFNTPENELPLMNGILDMDTNQLRDYSIHDFYTTRLPIYFDPTAACPRIDAFLTQVVKEENVKLLKEIAAYCLYRGYPLQTAFMLIGQGSNGKSVYLNLLKTILGQENVVSVSVQDLEEKPFAPAQLYLKMANIYADLSSKAMYNSGKFKMLTGGDSITAERKFGQPFNFINRAKMIYSCNQIPIAYDDSDAYHRRWIIVNFPFRFDEKTADPKLLQKLITAAEVSGFLNQLIPVLKELIDRGRFSYEMTIEQRRELYKRLSDPVEAFCIDMVAYDADGWIGKKELYTAFCEYCREKNYAVIAESTFAKRLHRVLGPTEARKKIGDDRIQSWLGIKLKEVEEGQGSQGSQGNQSYLSVQKENTYKEYNKEKSLTSLTPLTQDSERGKCDYCFNEELLVEAIVEKDPYRHGALMTLRRCQKCKDKAAQPV